MPKKLPVILVLLAIISPAAAERIPGRYIVELSTESVSEHVARMPRSAGRSSRERLASVAASSQRTLVRGQQQVARSRLEQRNARVLDSIDTVANALFVQVSDQAAAQLSAVPGVKRVVPARRFDMLLDRAVALHKVVDAWNRIGEGNAGAGVRIAILDSGIEASHPAFQDASLTAPASYPRVNNASDVAYTNGKIIVARSYVSMLPRFDMDISARDRVGHGTALAMVAAGVRNAGPLASITGVAPKAYLGNYRIFGTPGFNDGTSEDVILKAIDDAVADGMDVINLSFGTNLAPRLSEDPTVQAIERATRAGVIVVAAAGNGGPEYATISSPATAPSAIAVGASTNDRTFAASVEVAGLSTFVALAGDGSAQATPVTGPITDVAQLDGNGLACSPLTANSLANRVALILRGSCTFETKLTNAQNAGAVGGVVYATKESPAPVGMAVGFATLPAEMISHQDGTAIKEQLASQPDLLATLKFTLSAVPTIPNRLTDFSAAGPNVDTGIKPDLTAAGSDIYTATQTVDSRGSMYSASGYISVNGTSFSAPLVAGAAAVLKSARPGLTVNQYRSLLMNTAASVSSQTGERAPLQQSGAGLLDLDGALTSTVTAYPAALSFGAGSGDAQLNSTITLTNLGSTTEAFQIEIPSLIGEVAPSTVEIGGGASALVPVFWAGSGLAPGTYERFITVTGSASGRQIRIPVWYAAASGVASRIAVMDSISSGRRGETYSDAIVLRATEASGIVIPQLQPDISVVSGGAVVTGITSHDSEIPGLIGINVQLGTEPGNNIFRIQAGNAVTEVAIPGR